MQLYYNSQDQARALAVKYSDQFQESSDLLDFVRFEHGVTELGQLVGLNRHGLLIAFHGREQVRENEVRVSDACFDFIFNEGPYQDAFIRQDTVQIYGRMQGGVLVDLIAFNFRAFVRPGQL